MLSRRIFFASAFAATLVVQADTAAASAQAFDLTTFADAERQGKPILVAIDSRWCPVCLVQRTILWALLRDDRFQRVVYLTIDFESQKAFARAFGVRSQSTLIVFKGSVEQGRSVGETNDRAIAELLDRIV